MTIEIVNELGQIPMSPNLAATLTRAAAYASAQSHVEVSLEHLLLALTEDPDAGVVLASSQIDLHRLHADISAHIGRIEDRLPPERGGTPGISADLRKILEAAAAAAAQGQRPDINGAIVMAAIIGEGQSIAANMLRAQGLTFQAAIVAIRSLQSQSAAGAVAPQHRSEPTADDALANARARVETRSADRQKSLPSPPQPTPAPASEVKIASPNPAPFNDVDVASPPAAAEAEATPVTAPPQPQPAAKKKKVASKPAKPVPAPAQDDWAPPAASRPSQPASQPRPNRAPPPIPTAEPGAPRPAPSVGAQPSPRIGASEPTSTQPPWQSPGNRSVGQVFERHQTRTGDPTRPPAGQPQAHAPGAPQPQRRHPIPAPQIDAGQLVENIPRKMRVARPVNIEVRIAKAEVKALAEGLDNGGGAYRHELQITKAMSVRLRAPDGGFHIETTSPETQWIGNALGLMANDFSAWRWSVTPTHRGRRRLQLVVSARTVGADGLVAETALPDQVFDVRVRANYGKAFLKLMGWALAAVTGGLLARFGEQAWDMANVALKTMSGS